MSTIKIDQFGGEMPSASPRALPAGAAQASYNLYLGTNEFRPLADMGGEVEDVALHDSAHNGGVMRSMYRVPGTSVWHASTYERSFVRTPINDAGLEGRIYLTTDAPSSHPSVFAGSDLNTERRLGVPAPSKPATALVTNNAVSLDWAWSHLYNVAAAQVLKAVRVYPKNTEPLDRYADTTPADGNPAVTIFAGTRSVGSLHIPWANGNPNIPLLLRDRWWQLSYGATPAKVESLGLDIRGFGAIWDDALGKHFIPINALPYAYRLTSDTLKTALQQIKQPEIPVDAVMTESTADDIPERLFTDTQIDALLAYLVALMDPETLCRSQRDELTALVKEFEWLLTDGTLDLNGETEPDVVTQPTLPTGEQYAVDEFGATLRTAEWVAYDMALLAYQQYQKLKSLYDSKVNYATEAQNNRIYTIQLRAAQVTREIENLLDAKWRSLATDVSWLHTFFDSQGGATAFTEIDYIKENRFYVATFVTDWGEESAPSPVTEWHYTGYRDWVTITAPVAPETRGIVGWRLYRGNTGTSQTAFQLVTLEATDGNAVLKDGVFYCLKLDMAFNDKVKSENLGEVLPTLTWLEPPGELRGLVSMPNGILAGFVGNTVHFSEPYVPYAWPLEYLVTTDAQIVGLGVFGQTLVVCTTANPYFITGADSASMSSVKMDANQSCASRRSIAAVQGAVLYASPDGLCAADSSGVSVVSQGLFTREAWQVFTPSTMIGIEHEGIYYLFYKGAGGGCFTFDMNAKKLGRVQNLGGVTAVFADREFDTLYVAVGNAIKPLHTNSTRMTARWKSPKITLPKQESMAWIKVMGDQTVNDSVVVRWYADGAWRYTTTLTNTEPARLPAGRWLEHEIEIESKARVTQVVMAGSTQELQAV